MPLQAIHTRSQRRSSGRDCGCGEVARGGCVFARNFSVARSTVLTERRHQIKHCISESLLACRLQLTPAKHRAMHYSCLRLPSRPVIYTLSFPQRRVSEDSCYARCDQSSQSFSVLLFVGYFFPPSLYDIKYSTSQVHPKQATKAQRGSRGIALLFL